MNFVTQSMRVGATVVAAAILASCSGGANTPGGSVLTPSAQSGVVPAVANKTTVSQTVPDVRKGKRGRAKITIRIPLKKKPGRRLHPEYISPSTKSMTVVVAGGAVPPQTFDLTPSSSGCSTTGGFTTCSKTAFLPPGQQTLTITLFDQTNGAGNQLSTASKQVTIDAGTVTNISITLDGVPATATVLLNGSAAATVPVGVATSVPATVTAYDADNNIIMSPGNYSTPVTLSDSDTSGATTLSQTSITAPGEAITLAYTGGTLASATITPSVNGTAQSSGAATLTPTTPGPGPSPDITEYSIPNGRPGSVVLGPDGNFWFTDVVQNKVGQLTPSGTITEFAASSGSRPSGITSGPDGALWFTEYNSGNIGRVTTDGATLTEYTLPSVSSSHPNGITAGPDGALWFTEACGNVNGVNCIGRITTDGQTITEYSIAERYPGPEGITTGPDGALWFTEQCDGVARITTTGTITQYTLANAGAKQAWGITPGPDGALWFTEYEGNQIGRVTTNGAITEYSIPTKNSHPVGITVGSDGALWFTEYSSGNFGRITTNGTITEYSGPICACYSGPSSTSTEPSAIVQGPNGSQQLWFAQSAANSIGFFQLSGSSPLVRTRRR